MKVIVDEYQGPKGKDLRKGKHVGYCTKCDLMLADYDKLQVNYRCPRCDAVVAKPTKKPEVAKKLVSDPWKGLKASKAGKEVDNGS